MDEHLIVSPAMCRKSLGKWTTYGMSLGQNPWRLYPNCPKKKLPNSLEPIYLPWSFPFGAEESLSVITITSHPSRVDGDRFLDRFQGSSSKRILSTSHIPLILPWHRAHCGFSPQRSRLVWRWHLEPPGHFDTQSGITKVSQSLDIFCLRPIFGGEQVCLRYTDTHKQKHKQYIFRVVFGVKLFFLSSALHCNY